MEHGLEFFGVEKYIVSPMADTETAIYTVQTLSGEEHIVSRNMDRLLDAGIITDKYIPLRELPLKSGGEWGKRIERLFPGYLFIETGNPERLFFHLKEIPRLSRLLGDREGSFYRLSSEEIRYIRRVGAPRKDHVFGISQVAIDDGRPDLKIGDRVRILSGDLLNFQGDIVRYDLHHRRVYLKTEMFGGTEVCVGIELIQKV